MSIEKQSGSPYVKNKTGITYNDNQLVYVSITVDDNISTWFWRGFVVGNDAFKLSSADRGDITINNESGHLIVNTAILSGDIVTLRGGEIRLVL